MFVQFFHFAYSHDFGYFSGKGYTRERIALDQLEVLDLFCDDEEIDREQSLRLKQSLDREKEASREQDALGGGKWHVWFYVPNQEQAQLADETHPICQVHCLV